MKGKIIGFAIVMAVLGLDAARAQFGEAFPVWFRLEDADHAAIMAAEDRILASEPIGRGTTESWAGEGTGNTGRITILKVFQKDEMPCLETAYDFRIARVADPIRYVVPWCRIADGSWKMAF